MEEHKKDFYLVHNVPDLWKKKIVKVKKKLKCIDFARRKAVCHITKYSPLLKYPIHSTHYKREPDTITFDEYNEEMWMLIKALKTMREGELSHFIWAGEKNFHMFNPEYLYVIEVIKVEDIGDEPKKDYKHESEKCTAYTFNGIRVVLEELQQQFFYLFNMKQYEDIISVNEEFAAMLRFTKVKNIVEDQDRKDLLIKCLTNVALCYLCQNEPNKTLEILREIEDFYWITKSPNLYFMKAKALRKMGFHEIALDCLMEASLYFRDSIEIANEMQKLQSNFPEFRRPKDSCCTQ